MKKWGRKKGKGKERTKGRRGKAPNSHFWLHRAGYGKKCI